MASVPAPGPPAAADPDRTATDRAHLQRITADRAHPQRITADRVHADRVDAVVVDGLSVWARAMDDLGLGRSALAVYRATREPFLAAVDPAAGCRIAFTATLLRPERRRRCFAAVLTDRAVMAWHRRGGTGVLEIPLAGVRTAQWRVGTVGALSGVSLLTVVGDAQEVTFRLPAFRPRAANLLCAAFRRSS